MAPFGLRVRLGLPAHNQGDRMNNALKAAVGAAAGAALLLGGAGTFAMWNDSVGSQADAIQTGTLTLSAATGAWTKASDGSSITTSTFHVVPNDVLKYTVPLTITATGDDLSAQLKAVTPKLSDGKGENAISTSDFTATAAYTSTDPKVTITGGSVATVTAPTSGSYKVNAVVTLTFNDVTGLASQNGKVALDNITFDLTQTAPVKG